jgi:hypothetical protein
VPLLCASCVAIDRSFTTPVHPQRPKLARDALTTVAGTIEVESGLLWVPDESFDVPITIKHGLSESAELAVTIDPIRTVDLPGGGDTTGIGDTYVAYKQRVLEQTHEAPTAAWEVATKLPSASSERGLGTGAIDVFGAGAATWIYDAWAANAYYRLGLRGAPEREGTNVEHLFSLVGSRPLLERLHGLGELALLWTPAIGDEQLVADLGLQYVQAPGVVFDAAVYVGLSSDAPDVAFAIGLTTNLGRQAWQLAR